MSPALTPHALRIQSPAKINLTLEILGRRGDGFHDIRSVVLGVNLRDDLRFDSGRDGDIELACNDRALPTDSGNIVVRAAESLRDRCDKPRGAHIELHKRIPVSAGLGGGSGNAAAALMALNRLWEVGLSDSELRSIGTTVGSDVALFFSLPSATLRGRGEIVEPVTLGWSGWVLLAWTGGQVSTNSVYAAWRDADRVGPNEKRIEAVRSAQTADELSECCINELAPAIFRIAPPVGEFREAVQRTVDRPAIVSGAGRTVFVLFDDPAEAERHRDVLRERRIGTGWSVVRALTDPMTLQ